MRHRVMVTTLFSGDNTSNKSYYHSLLDSGKAVYCDALMPAEATCKFMLSTVPIDEIIVIGSATTDTAEDDSRLVALKDSAPASTVNLDGLSRYDLLRYRLCEYMDDIRAESQDIDALVSREEAEKVLAFIRDFFDERLPDMKDKPNRYFHLLAQDRKLLDALHEALRATLPEADYERFRTWVHHHLFLTMKETYKMDLLEANANVRIRFIPVRRSESFEFLKRIMGTLAQADNPNAHKGIDLYLCLQNSEASVTMSIVNFTNLLRVIPDSQIRICKIFTVSAQPDGLAGQISDDTETQSVSSLLSGMDAFLKNGKAKGVVEYWKRVDVKNPKIDSVVYAMRNIDYGISLCDINDIERGIRSLRKLLSSEKLIDGHTSKEQLFEILLDATRRDYGRLLETDRVQFIDLVRWAYRKEFWQQTLTLIESRAPQDFIGNGFFYYCDSEESREQVGKVFGQIYYDLRPFEKYKLDNPSHYYIKYYNRQKANHQKHGKEYIQDYARLRAEELNSVNPGEIRAYTICPDRAAVEELLFAYYYVGDVRNQTNHAKETFDGFYSIMPDSDRGERMELIRQSIDYFLHCYDRVVQLSAGRTANVIEITNEDIIRHADQLRQEYRSRER